MSYVNRRVLNVGHVRGWGKETDHSRGVKEYETIFPYSEKAQIGEEAQK